MKKLALNEEINWDLITKNINSHPGNLCREGFSRVPGRSGEMGIRLNFQD